ncbi:Enteropeptidase [Entomophthora muscae]|uniref:Enteropeptidase n=1 Tax=Entomophthora muscae TaxID=34485 RepID=A0ACC2S885_9FUNG|nr:Enteropeptidase [Entomophthora muscae]
MKVLYTGLLSFGMGLLVAKHNPFEKFKFLASIYFDGFFLCDGTFITSDVVLTAAFCVRDDVKHLKVADHFQEASYNILEQRSLLSVNYTQILLRLSTGDGLGSNIAAIKLTEKRQHHTPIELNLGFYSLWHGLSLEAIEWMRYINRPKTPHPIRLKTLPHYNCILSSPSKEDLCVTFPHPPKIEPGGPLIYHSGSEVVLVGILSRPNRNKYSPSVIFTSVSSFIPWIQGLGAIPT